ncbi:hypothetical protein GLYMA_06G183200v4 [Glycine max]|uniref:Uncharacterized protein n=1 Tax=Glycine max TaxID=3847 RepID=K7KVT6_SOYBN|nr:hypothetical protein GYH30_015505 [Glycine max]KRH54412.1 hypothetical protein GLYMA_06G183200v4 [Glycine max]
MLHFFGLEVPGCCLWISNKGKPPNDDSYQITSKHINYFIYSFKNTNFKSTSLPISLPKHTFNSIYSPTPDNEL